MISFFPSPYPDELWYSVICRYHVHSGNYCAKHTLRQLYGDNFCAPSLMLCGPIKALLAQLPQGFLSAKDVVMQHTFYPYYARFFPTQRKRSSYAYVVNGNPLAVHRMGISQANGNHCSVMRYCPVCYQEDLQLYGEPYWHRSHQLPDMQFSAVGSNMILFGVLTLAEISPEISTTSAVPCQLRNVGISKALVLPVPDGPITRICPSSCSGE